MIFPELPTSKDKSFFSYYCMYVCICMYTELATPHRAFQVQCKQIVINKHSL